MGAIHHQDHLCHNSASTAGEEKKKKRKKLFLLTNVNFKWMLQIKMLNK